MFSTNSFAVLSSAVLLGFSTLASAAPAPAQPSAGPVVNVVFNPVITSPYSGDVWTVGALQTVTWETSLIPKEEQNSTGSLILGYVDSSGSSEHLDIAHPLAVGFPLSDGAVNVTVPTVVDRDDYILVLFGDSGNASPKFTIKNPDTVTSSVVSVSSTVISTPVPTSSASGVVSTEVSSVTPTATA